MKHRIGWWTGMACGGAGLVAGQACAWAGFLSQPHHAGDLGTFCGVMGALTGLTLGVFGVIAKRYSAA